MTWDDFLLCLKDFASDFHFEYKGKECSIYLGDIDGLDYTIYYGDSKPISVYTIDDLLSAPAFDGKSISEIYPEIDMWAA